MTKLAALLTTLLTLEPHKASAAEAQKELDALVAELAGAKTKVTELTTAVADLDPKAKNAEKLQGLVTLYQKRDSDVLVGKHFAERAAKAGVKATAIATAQKLADLSKVAVDVTKGEVTGLTDDVFAGLKKDHPILFGDNAAPTVLSALGQPASGAAPVAPKMPGAMGMFLAASQAAQ